MKINYLFLPVCLFIASVFIFDHIQVRSFWLDEAAVANILRVPFKDVFNRALVEGHPISYIFILKIWSDFFGTSEVALRSFSALATLLLIIVLYKTAAELFPKSAAKYWAAFLAATNYFLIWHSSQAKGYTFIALVGLLSFYFFWILVRRFPQKALPAYLLVTLLGTYSHPWVVFLFGGQMLALILFRKSIPVFRKILIAQLAIIALSLPVWLGLLSLAGAGAADWERGSISLATLWESLKIVVLYQEWPYLLLSGVTVYFLVKRRHVFVDRFVLVFLGLYLFLAPVAAIFVSLLISPAYAVGRYEMIVIPALMLLAARLFSETGTWLSLVGGGLILLSVANAVQIDRQTATALSVFDDRVAAARLFAKINNGDTIIATDLTLPTFDYYFKRLNNGSLKNYHLVNFPAELAQHPAWKSLPRMLARQEDYQKEAKMLAAETLEGNIWVIYNSANSLDKFLYDELSSRYKLVSNETLPLVHAPLWFDTILQFRKV